MADNNNNAGVFVYTEGMIVPRNVIHVRVHPSVTVIPEKAFRRCVRLEEVELCDGLLEIGDFAFYECRALTRISIPSTVTEIGRFSFYKTNIHAYHLPDSIENLGRCAFHSCKMTNFKVPSQIRTIPESAFSCCESLFSIELENVTNIGILAFPASLRNIALGDNYVVGTRYYDYGDTDSMFRFSDDLNTLFGKDSSDYDSLTTRSTQIIDALKHRFVNLPIHKMIYYQSYNNVTVDELINATEIRISQRQTGRQQDCLGMTPLHILACSTVQNIELYRVLVDKYPETLVTQDRFRALPILYAVWGQAPDEIIQFLVDSYTSIHLNYEFDWNNMVKTLAISRASPIVIQCLLDIQQQYFPDQLIDWEDVLDNLGKRGKCLATFSFLVNCSIAKRVKAVGLKQYRDAIMKKADCMATTRADHISDKDKFLDENERVKFKIQVQTMIGQYEFEYQILKEATSMLELVLWKKSISETMSDEGRKRKFDDSDRCQCRISCGADIVIPHVLPYLMPCAARIYLLGL